MEHLDTAEAAERLGLTFRFLEGLRGKDGEPGEGPPYWQPTDAPNARVKYPVKGLDAWAARRQSGGVRTIAGLIESLEARVEECKVQWAIAETAQESYRREGVRDGLVEALSALRAFETPTPT